MRIIIKEKQIIFASVKEPYSYYYLITVAYTAVFLTLGVVLLWGNVPRQARLRDYISGRRYFSAAFLSLGVFGITDLASWRFVYDNFAGYNAGTLYIMIGASMVHAWLNGYGYLLMLSPSPQNRRRVLRFGQLTLPAILLAGGFVTILLPHAARHFIWLLDLIYGVEIAWIFGLCRKEHDTNVKALDNYYDEPARLEWMTSVMNLTLVSAFFNIVQHYLPAVGIPFRIANTLFYIYFFIHIIDYIPAFLSVEKATVGEKKEDMPPEKENAPSYAVRKSPRYYPENLPEMIAVWLKSGRFCEENLNITDVARQLNTNRSYLSVYLNQQLGVTYSQWLNTLRIEHAKELIHDFPDKTVAEIGVMVGIPEPYNFSRWFKRVTGVTPQRFMR